MDYKKLIIVNLVCLIIIGKLLQFIFMKMQNGYKFINIDNNLIEIFNRYDNLENNIIEIKEDELASLKQKYTKIENYINNEEELIKIVKFVKYNNNLCNTLRKRKLKIFWTILLSIIFINFIVIKNYIPWDKIKKVKKKVKIILNKINELNK